MRSCQCSEVVTPSQPSLSKETHIGEKAFKSNHPSDLQTTYQTESTHTSVSKEIQVKRSRTRRVRLGKGMLVQEIDLKDPEEALVVINSSFYHQLSNEESLDCQAYTGCSTK